MAEVLHSLTHLAALQMASVNSQEVRTLVLARMLAESWIWKRSKTSSKQTASHQFGTRQPLSSG